MKHSLLILALAAFGFAALVGGPGRLETAWISPAWAEDKYTYHKVGDDSGDYVVMKGEKFVTKEGTLSDSFEDAARWESADQAQQVVDSRNKREAAGK